MSQLDPLSDLRVPFSVAAYCRQRKFHPTTVKLLMSLRAERQAKEHLASAEKAMEDAQASVAAQIQEAQSWVDENDRASATKSNP